MATSGVKKGMEHANEIPSGHHHAGPSRWKVVGGLAVAVTLLASCGQSAAHQGLTAHQPSKDSTTTISSTTPPIAPSTTPVTPPAAPSTTTTTPASSGSPVAVDDVPWCTGGELIVSLGREGAAAGHVGMPVVFQNIGSASCSLYGYPGVAGLDAAGDQVSQAQRIPAGYLGGTVGAPPVVILDSGQLASALVEGTDNPLNGATTCVTYSALLATPPNTSTSTQLDVQLPGCSGLEVHPVVMGTTGLEQDT
jgi:hypothetical protein